MGSNFMDTFLLVKEITQLLTDKEKGLEEINNILSKKEATDLVKLFANLSNYSLIALHTLVDHLELGEEDKEHLIYLYYYRRIRKQEIDELSLESLVKDLLADYTKYEFIAIESVLIRLLKHYTIAPHQIASIHEIVQTEAMAKVLTKYDFYQSMKKGVTLSKEQVIDLLTLEYFDVLQAAMDQKMIERDGLKVFKEPVKGERYKNVKYPLYLKARRLLKE